MTYQLYPHQAKAAGLLAGGSAVLWWEMRTGKTRAVLHAYNELVLQGEVDDLVVVAPLTIRAVWKEEAEAMGLGIPILDLRGTVNRSARPAELAANPMRLPRIILINPELLSHWLPQLQAGLLKPGRFALVADESHLYLRRTSGATARWTAFDALAQGSDHVWLLSGTFYVKTGLDIYWQMRPLGPDANPFHWMKKACYDRLKPCGRCFACRYCHMRTNAFSQTGVEYGGITNEKDLLKRASCISVIREQDIRDVPIVDRFPVWVGDTGDESWDPDIDLDDFELGVKLSELVPLKVELALKYLRDLRESYPDEPLVVFGWHVAFVEQLAKALGAPFVTGGTSAAARTQIRHDFAAGKIPILVGNLMAMGMGIDLSAAGHFVYGEPYYDAAMHYQAEARGRGPRQHRRRLLHHYLLVRRSAEENVWRVRLARGQAIERLYDAGREAAEDVDRRPREEAM